MGRQAKVGEDGPWRPVFPPRARRSMHPMPAALDWPPSFAEPSGRSASSRLKLVDELSPASCTPAYEAIHEDAAQEHAPLCRRRAARRRCRQRSVVDRQWLAVGWALEPGHLHSRSRACSTSQSRHDRLSSRRMPGSAATALTARGPAPPSHVSAARARSSPRLDLPVGRASLISVRRARAMASTSDNRD
jgi:hypothetical protein